MRIHRTTLNVTTEAIDAGSRMVPAGTILAVVRGMSLAKEFRVGIAARAVAFNQDLKAIANERDVEALFLFHALDAMREQIRERAGDASHGTKKLDTPVLAGVSIHVPPPSVQDFFREHVRPYHAQWDNLDQQNEQLRIARDLLLPRLMNGEVAV
jgi:type I restriction enzyme S subunit